MKYLHNTTLGISPDDEEANDSPRRHRQHRRRRSKQPSHVHFINAEMNEDDYTHVFDDRQDYECRHHSSNNPHRHVLPTLPPTSSFSSNDDGTIVSSYTANNNQSLYNFEVSCEDNPTQLFVLMNHRLWDKALTHVSHCGMEARIWITSSSSSPRNNNGINASLRWRNLPLHLACLQGMDNLVPLRLIEALIEAYPKGAQCRNLEGNLPIHLACECMEFTSNAGLEVEGILAALIKAFPGCLMLKDSRGRRPLEVLEEKGLRCDGNRMNKRGVAIMKYMKMQMKVMEKLHCEEERIVVDSARKGRGATRKGDKKTKRRHHDKENDVYSLQHQHCHQQHHQLEGLEYCENNEATVTQLPSLPNTVNSFIMPSCPTPIITPKSMLTPIPTTVSCQSPANNHNVAPTDDPFQHLESELYSMRNAHQAMSDLLNVKISSENELRDRLAKLEAQYAKLQNDHNVVIAIHSSVMTKYEAQTRSLESLKHENQVLNTKEQALSKELAIKLGNEEKHTVEIERLLKELEDERRARKSVEDKLELQIRKCDELEETNQHMLLSNVDFEKEFTSVKNERSVLEREKRGLLSEITEKDVQLEEAKTRESALTEQLILKSKCIDELERSSLEDEALASENDALKSEIAKKDGQLEEAKANESAWKEQLMMKSTYIDELKKVHSEDYDTLAASYSAAKAHSIQMISVTRKHINKIESLFEMAMALEPRSNQEDLDSERGDVLKCIELANEITSIFKEAMANLVHDTKLLKQIGRDVAMAYEEYSEVKSRITAEEGVSLVNKLA